MSCSGDPEQGDTDLTTAAAPPPPTVSISGTVKRTCDGSPISKFPLALVDSATEKSASNAATLTDSDGTFTFSQVSAGSYKLFTVDCFEKPEQKAAQVGSVIVIDPPSPPAPINFQYSPKVIDPKNHVCGPDVDCDSYVDKVSGGTDNDDTKPVACAEWSCNCDVTCQGTNQIPSRTITIPRGGAIIIGNASGVECALDNTDKATVATTAAGNCSQDVVSYQCPTGTAKLSCGTCGCSATAKTCARNLCK
ncbi:MAG: carboxypeptidase regulatory-like domain-containing protein [Nitrospirae bacterium]|nr:carboxypeptidase regulatory-like domain-containing protein [Nitrospirota bacterium]